MRGAPGRCGVALLDRDGLVAERGSRDAALPWASVTKLATAWTSLIAVDRGLVSLDDPAGPPGATVRHLLAHASGLAFDDATVVSPPARTRIYSNTGYDALAATVEAGAGRPFGVLLREWLLEPLEMTGARLVGPPSQGLVGTLRDLEALAFELLVPRLLTPETAVLRDVGRLPRAARHPARVRAAGRQRLGARAGDPRRQGAALDGERQLAADVRALRRQRHVRVDRPGRGARARRPHRPDVRRLGDRGLAPVLGRGARSGSLAPRRRARAATSPSCPARP